jgi:hypothetical protein
MNEYFASHKNEKMAYICVLGEHDFASEEQAMASKDRAMG